MAYKEDYFAGKHIDTYGRRINKTSFYSSYWRFGGRQK